MEEEIITDEIIKDESATDNNRENGSDNSDNNIEKSSERGITIADILARIWISKYVIIIFIALGIAIGLIIGFGTPPTYKSALRMVPEAAKSSNGASAALAALGVGTETQTDDAYPPSLYPDIVSSIPFITELFDVEIQTSKSDSTYTLRDYFEYHTVSPWWNFSKKEEEKEIRKSRNEIIDPFQLTDSEYDLYTQIRNSIYVHVDRRTAEVAVTVVMQDPLVAAQLTDTVAARLQEYITDYRTAKARHDLDYAIEINEEAKKQYYEAQQTYADYMDRNQNLALYSAQTTRDRLQNDMQLAFNLYNQTSQQVQQCEAKVQEVTPVFAVVEPSSVAVLPSAPKKTNILVMSTLIATFLGIIICCIPLFVNRSLYSKIRSSILHQKKKSKKASRYSSESLEEEIIETEQDGEYYSLEEDHSRYAPKPDDNEE